MFLPGCDRCGQCGCACGELPYTVTVQFANLVNRVHSHHCDLTITSDFGCGAAGVAISPGGCKTSEPECGASDVGPLTAVLLTEPGHDYARLARVEPTLTVAGRGAGATFTPTLVPVDDKLSYSCQSWKLDSVAVTGGTGYSDGEVLSITPDGKTVTQAVATLSTTRSAPTVTATAPGGTGGVLAVTLSSSGTPTTWSVSSVSVTSGGSGYTDGAAVTFSVAAGDKVVTKATATIATGGSSPPTPVLTLTSYDDPPGSGASFSLNWVPAGSKWNVASVTIISGGSGYFSGGVASWEHPDGYAHGIYAGDLIVNGSGEITGIDVQSDTDFDGVTGGGSGAISSVSVTGGGSYYHDSGVPDSVTVTTPGEYYTEDPESPPCVANVTVTAPQCYDNGESLTEATLSATVDDDPTSATFGQITGITIDDGGDGYLVWHWICTSLSVLSGLDFVLAAVNAKKLVTLGVNSCFGSGACIEIVPVGSGEVCDPLIPAAYDGQPGPILEIDLTNGGSGYARLGREQPEWTVSMYGWTFTPVFSAEQTDECGLPYWYVESFEIGETTGSAMAPVEPLDTVVTGAEKYDVKAIAWVTSEDGVPTSVTVRDGGRYYRENAALPPHVATVNVSVDQLPQSTGSGASVSVVVEDDTSSPDFGKIVSATLVSGGSNYTLLGGPQDCRYRLDKCAVEFAPRMELRLRGNDREPELAIIDNRTYPGTEIVLRATEVLGDCDDLPGSYTHFYGGAPTITATLTAGGVYQTPCSSTALCDGCVCPVDDIPPTTPVSVSSDIPCANGGTAGFDGEWQDLDLDCGYRDVADGPIVYTNEIGFSLICCEQVCEADGGCVFKVRAAVFGYCYDPVTDTFCAVHADDHECQDVAVVDGVPTGTIVVPVIACIPPNEVAYTMTIVLG